MYASTSQVREPENSRTYSLKLLKKKCRSHLRVNFFGCRHLNSPPDTVVSASSFNCFKSRCDKQRPALHMTEAESRSIYTQPCLLQSKKKKNMMMMMIKVWVGRTPSKRSPSVSVLDLRQQINYW